MPGKECRAHTPTSRRESRISAVRLPDSAWQAKAAPSARNSDTQSGSQAVTATGFDPVIGGSNPPPAANLQISPFRAVQGKPYPPESVMMPVPIPLHRPEQR